VYSVARLRKLISVIRYHSLKKAIRAYLYENFFNIILFWEPITKWFKMCEFRFRSSVRIIVESVISLRVFIIFFGPSNPPPPWRMQCTTRKLNQALIYGLRTHKKNHHFSVTLTRILCRRIVKNVFSSSLWPLQLPSTLKNEVYDSKIEPGTHLWSKNPQKFPIFLSL